MNERMQKLAQFLEQTPDDCFLNHAMALEYVKMGEDRQAGLLFQKNMNHDPAYLATYYHYAKLLERLGQEEQAIPVYEQGMLYSKQAGDNHTLSELRSAYEELTF